ncbi:MAG: outer membrane lipoprotein carrier protein LolA [Bacteroidota bacterium]
MRKLLITFFIILHYTFCSLYSQLNAQTQGDIDPKAKAILDEVSARTKSYTSIKAEFIYTLENKVDNITDSQEGALLIKGDKYKLDISGQEIISDGKTRWTYLKDVQEVQISEQEDDEGTISPANIFTIYEKGFKYRFFKEETIDGKSVQLINLYPVDAKEKPYHTIQLTIDKNKKQLVTIKILSKDGNDYIYKINKFTTNLPVEESQFTFKPSDHPDVEVIDLR